MAHTEILAVVFDFDDTLAPDSTTKFLVSKGVDPVSFWADAGKLIAQGFDPALAWLKLFLDNVGDDKPFGQLTNPELAAFGPTLDNDFFPGVPGVFQDLQSIVSEYEDVSIEFYIVSGGLRTLISSSEVVQANFKAVYGCELAGEIDGPLRYIKRCVTFTEKTRYIFEINKGIPQAKADKNAGLVNAAVPPSERRIPLSNMIYVGDGMTDIPAFSLLDHNKGLGFGVFDPSDEAKAKRAFTEFLQSKRVTNMNPPNYESKQALGSLLRAAVAGKCTQLQVNRGRA